MTDQQRADRISEEHGLTAKVLCPGCIRLTDGGRTLDVYKKKYFELDTKKRGVLVNEDELIANYFSYQQEELQAEIEQERKDALMSAIALITLCQVFSHADNFKTHAKRVFDYINKQS